MCSSKAMDTLLSMDKRVITELLNLYKNEVSCWNCRKGCVWTYPSHYRKRRFNLLDSREMTGHLVACIDFFHDWRRFPTDILKIPAPGME